MKAFRVVWDGDTTITWEDEVTISTGGSGGVANGNINPVSASFSRVTEGRLCVHNYTAGSLQVYDIDWVNGTTQVGNNFSITASSSTSGTSNYYGVDVKTAWNPLTDEVIKEFEDMGVSRLILLQTGQNEEQMLEYIDQIAKDFL